MRALQSVNLCVQPTVKKTKHLFGFDTEKTLLDKLLS